MNKMMKLALASAIALSAGSAWAQAAVTGKQVLGGNKFSWDPAIAPIGNTEVSAHTGTFHAGGVAACDGCHVMHNASNGVTRSTKVSPWTDAVPAFLLQGSDQSSTCLICHGDNATGASGAGIATAANKPYVITNTSTAIANMNYTPGGDFGWLAMDLGSTAQGTSLERRGHNVVASDFGLGADVGMRTAPGGTFSVDTTGVRAFACSNCHDPHGRFRLQFNDGVSFQWAGPNPTTGLVAITQPIFASSSYGVAPTALGAVGAYRLLAGTGYLPASMVTGAFPFVNNPPVAVAPTNYNRPEVGASVATNQVRVAYGAGMSEWCQNCHTNIHLDNYTSGALGGVGLRHPAGTGAILKPGQVTVYNSYVSSGVFSSVAADRYNSLVPFENAKKLGLDAAAVGVVPATAITALRTAATAGVDANIFAKADDANVMCLSCHRAHASAFPAMVRWNNDDTFITNSTVFTNTGGRADMSVAYYGRTKADFGNYQRSMCNKCHGKD